MPAQSLICPVLIGQEAHLETMEHVLVQARTGQGRVILVAGEAGWGKSRLTNEFKIRAAEQGWRCLQGDCFDTERSLPYAPITGILQKLDQIPTTLTPLLSRTSSPGSIDKHQLYFELVAFLSDLGASQPLLIVVEDLHWCDDASLEALLYLSRKLENSPVLFLVTFRDNEVQPSLAHYLSQLDRERRSQEIKLAPFSKADTSLMVQTIFAQNRPTRAEFIDKLYPLTEGNPFYIEETLKSMLMAGDIVVSDDGIWAEGALSDLHIPRSVQDSVQQRSQQLSSEARDVLTLAAVAGRHFDFDLLQKLTGHDETILLKLFKELLAAQLITEVSADQFAFRHALTREAIYLNLLARERRQLHAQIADTLEALSGGSDSHLGDLAYHFYIGEKWDKALIYARQAGERAQALYAAPVAVEHFTRALEAANQLSDPSRGSLHLKRGLAYASLNNFDAAQKDFLIALDSARQQADSHAEWKTLLALGDLWATRDYVPAGKYFEQALNLVRTLDDPAAVGYTLNHMGNWRMNQEFPFDALQDHLEALEIFQSLNDQVGIAQSLDFLGVTAFNCGDLVLSRQYYQQALPLLQTVNDQRGLMHTLGGLSLAIEFDLEYDDVHADKAVDWGQRGLQVAREIGWRSGEALSLICLGLAYRQQGDYGQTLSLFERALDVATEIEHNSWLADSSRALGATYLDLLDPDEARIRLEKALGIARQLNSPIWIRQSIAALVAVYIQQGEFESARALLEGVWGVDTPMQGLQNRFLWAARIELALATSELDRALDWVDQLIATTKNLDPVPAPENGSRPEPRKIVPRLWQLRGEILSALHRYPEAERDFTSALTAAQSQGRKGRQWELYRDLMRVHLAQKHLDAVREYSVEARQLIMELAATLTDTYPEPAEHFTKQALASLPEIPEPSAKQQLKQKFGGLTAREREIAARVAQGKTNREIADELVLSERTAERHIANIMKKLGFSTRSQIAAWVVEKGLDYTQV